MRNTRKTRYKGGKVIGAGGFGCVFQPALTCLNDSKNDNKKNTRKNKKNISKLMTVKHAEEEYQQIQRLKKVLNKIPNYSKHFIVDNVSVCKPKKLNAEDLESYSAKCSALTKKDITHSNINTNLDKVMALNLPFGGEPIDDYLYSHGGYDTLQSTHEKMVDLLKNGIVPMNELNIFHSDIKDSNILINGKTAVLIDWGLTAELSNSSEIPSNWKNRPFQFNVPFTIVLFSDMFAEMYDKFLGETDRTDHSTVKPFAIDFINKWIAERGPGHYRFINEIMYLVYGNHLTSISVKKRPLIIETEFTMPYIVESLVNVILSFNPSKSVSNNLRKYMNRAFKYNIDIWGFVCAYYPMLEMFGTNYTTLEHDEMAIYNAVRQLFIKYLYTPRHDRIDLPTLLTDLDVLDEAIRARNFGLAQESESLNPSYTYSTSLNESVPSADMLPVPAFSTTKSSDSSDSSSSNLPQFESNLPTFNPPSSLLRGGKNVARRVPDEGGMRSQQRSTHFSIKEKVGDFKDEIKEKINIRPFVKRITKKYTGTSSIFKRRTLVKRFKNPIFLSIQS